MSDAITVTDLVVDRGKAIVLKSLTCRAAAGRITGLPGPSGSGKTTSSARSSVSSWSGPAPSPCSASPPAPPAGEDRLCEQAPSVYPDLTVLENAKYFASIAGAGRRRPGRSRAGRPCRRGRAAGRHPLRRSAVPGVPGLHIVGDPAVLVLDEPTVGQDPVLREEFWASSGSGRRRDHRVGLLARDGRGEPLRPSAADPRWRPARRRHPDEVKRTARTDDLNRHS